MSVTYYQMFSYVVLVAYATRPENGLLGLFLVRWQQGRMRYPFSRLTILHRFFEISTSMVFYPASAVTLLFVL